MRSPGAYEARRWSVSPLNRSADVVGSMPERIRLRDVTLRSLETLPGVVLTEERKRAFLTRLVRAGLGEVVIAPARKRPVEAVRADIESIRETNSECRVTCPMVFTPADLASAAAAGFDAVQVWVPPWGEASLMYEPVAIQSAWEGKDWRELQLPRRAERRPALVPICP